jgi:hypothetical protein
MCKTQYLDLIITGSCRGFCKKKTPSSSLGHNRGQGRPRLREEGGGAGDLETYGLGGRRRMQRRGREIAQENSPAAETNRRH